MGNRSRAILAVVAFFVMVAIGGSSAQASAPGPSPAGNDCLTQILNMSDCLSYVVARSNVTVPDKACCPELAGLVESNPICLCELLGKADAYGIQIDLERALKLPSVCRVTTPPLDLCSVAGVPIGAPTASQGPLPPGVESPAGLPTSPSSGNSDNAASGSACSVLAVLVGSALAFLII